MAKQKSEMKHVMIDLETMGVRPTSVFTSIAAIQFDLDTGTLGKIFKAQVSMTNSLKLGLTVDASTIKWWLAQDKEVAEKMFEDTKPLNTVVGEFITWYKEAGLVYPWGNSASFDLSILGNAMDVLEYSRPWLPWNERCYRTIHSQYKKLVNPLIINDCPHDPVEDCKFQIAKLCDIHQKIEKALKNGKN